MEKRKDPKEKKCAICGKDIYAGEEWAYKRRENGERTKWFCSYKCMRTYDAKHEKKERPVERPEKTEAAAPKEPTSRAVAAKELAEEIRAGRSVIAYLKEAGYKNPWEAYQAIRHYCETNMPGMLEVLKPLKELPKAPQQKTGRPRKHPAEVKTVEKVPDIEQPETQVAEILKLRGGVDYQLKVDEAMKAEKPEEEMANPHPQEVLLTLDHVLRTVDEAALECNGDEKFGIWSNEDLGKVLFREAWKNAKKTGVMEMRKAIRQKLGVTE